MVVQGPDPLKTDCDPAHRLFDYMDLYPGSHFLQVKIVSPDNYWEYFLNKSILMG